MNQSSVVRRAAGRLVAPILALAAIVPAQGPAEDLAPATMPAMDQLFLPTGVLHDRIGDTEWAAAAAWKAAFAPDGATFVPFLGSDAPRNWPVTFATRRATVDGAELPLQHGVAAARVGLSVSYRRGGLVERYDLSAKGLEQSFHFEALPCRGELTVEIATATDLECRPDGAGFRFDGPNGGVRYGAALAYDAAGRRLPLATSWQDQALRITVPAAFVQQAELPLVIDPSIASAAYLAAVARTHTSPDICFDQSLGRHASVHESVFSQTDSDVYLRVLDPLLQSVGGGVAIDLSVVSWQQCRIARAEGADRCLVVAVVSNNNVSPFDIRGRIYVHGATPTVLAPFTIDTGNGDAWNPDVGGSAAGQSDHFCVTWQSVWTSSDHDIVARTYDASGQPAGSPFLVDASLGFEHHPVISPNRADATSSAPAVWAIAYRRADPAILNGHLRGAVVGVAGAQVVGGGSNWPLGPSALSTADRWSVSSPMLHHGAWTWMVAQSIPPGLAQGARVVLTAFTMGAVVAGPSTPLPQGFSQRHPTIESDGCRFALAWTDVDTGYYRHIHAATVAILGSQVVVHDVDVLAATPDDETEPSITATGGPQRHAVTWIADSAASPGMMRVGFRLYDAYSLGALFGQRNTGCGSLGIGPPLGSPYLGQSFSLGLVGASGGLAGFVVGAPVNAPLPFCPGCIQGVDGNTVIGTVLPVSVPCNAALVGGTVAFQGFDFGSGPCLGLVSLSHTYDVTVR